MFSLLQAKTDNIQTCTSFWCLLLSPLLLKYYQWVANTNMETAASRKKCLFSKLFLQAMYRIYHTW